MTEARRPVKRLWAAVRRALAPPARQGRENRLYGPPASPRPEPFRSGEKYHTGQPERPNRAGEHKRETRRKILAGAAALKHAETDPAARAHLWALLDQMLDENRDRELFDLEPLDAKQTRRGRQPALPWDGETERSR